jgi:hypothetical protein
LPTPETLASETVFEAAGAAAEDFCACCELEPQAVNAAAASATDMRGMILFMACNTELLPIRMGLAV